jgi:hypothetical protein
MSDLQPAAAETSPPGGSAINEELLAWGERPDSYFAMMGVTAIGWA